MITACFALRHSYTKQIRIVPSGLILGDTTFYLLTSQPYEHKQLIVCGSGHIYVRQLQQFTTYRSASSIMNLQMVYLNVILRLSLYHNAKFCGMRNFSTGTFFY